MEAFVLTGGFLLAAAAGYFASGHLGHFLERGGISPYWDEAEEKAANHEKKSPSPQAPKKRKTVAARPNSIYDRGSL